MDATKQPVFFRLSKSAILGMGIVLAFPLAVFGQTTIFNDTFNSGSLSTLNGTSTPGGTASASSTSYDVASSKTGSCTITAGTPGFLRAKLASGTTAGYMELQAIFTSTPVQLVNVGDSINLTVTFTNSAGTLLSGGTGSDINMGLYYSGGSKPYAGNLNASGLGSATTFATGGCSNWQGYVSQLVSNTIASTIFTRPVQISGTTSANQDLVFSGGGTGLFGGPAGTTLGSSTPSTLIFTSGAIYTESFTILLSAANTVLVTEKLYAGGNTSGTVLFSMAEMSSGGNTYTNFSNQYDGVAIGIDNKGTSQDPQMDISQITISKNSYAAPVINNLTNQTVIAGTTTTLSPTVTGNPAPAYQWQTNNVNIGGATNASLVLNNVQYTQNNWTYSLIATNLAGDVTNSMTLSVVVPPGITGLNNQATTVGNTVTITPTVTGESAPACQWFYGSAPLTDGLDANGSTISGSGTSSLSITNAQVADTGTYSLVASNSAGMVTNSMNLTIATGNLLPSITGPTNITVIQGSNGTFSASATGVPLPTLQWLDQTGTPIPGATSSSLTLTNVQYSQNGFAYSIVASNTVGSVTNNAMLTVIVPPAIGTQPVNLVVTNTQSATFSVVASGVPAVAYQWYYNNTSIGGATSSSYTIASTAPANAGVYYVVITNAAGTVTSSNATLMVNSAMSATAFSPNNGATGICYDTPLAVTFSSSISLGTNGTIKIYNVTNSATPVDTINVSLGAVQQRTFPGDGQSFSYQTIAINGGTAEIYPHFNVMTSNQTYYVTIDNGAFTDLAGANFAGIIATNTWQFSTKVGGPANPAKPVVSAAGSADFLTVQGAVNSIPAGNASPVVINIQNGTYMEIVDVAGKSNIVFRGQSRLGTLVGFPNNANFQAANSGSTHDRMAFKVDANDIVLDNLTVTNMTPQGGAQAEALMIETSAQRCIVNNCDIVSRQDTVLANVNTSQAYFYHSTVRGNFDYIWGGGNLFFYQCVMDTIAGVGPGGANLTAARTTTAATVSTNFPWLNPSSTYTANGMTFVDCSFTADASAGTVTLADGNGSADELVSWYGCDFATNYISPSATLFSGDYLFWQDLNTMTNNSISFAVVTSLTGNDPRLLAATNVPTWLYGWNPQLAPNITNQPAGQAVFAGQSASFNVGATGIPDPTYQWLLNGLPVSGATAATYNIASAARTNGGNYTVVVSNNSGSVTSLVAVLTYSNTPPVAANVSYTRNVAVNQLNINIPGLLTNNVTDADGDAISLVSVGVSTNGVTPVINGNFINYYNANAVTDQFTYTVTDGFGGTNTAVITVNISTQPLFGQSTPGINSSGGSIVLSLAGIPNYSYSVQRSTNVTFVPFDTVLTTNAPNTGVFQFIDSNPPQPTAYYRLLYNP